MVLLAHVYRFTFNTQSVNGLCRLCDAPGRQISTESLSVVLLEETLSERKVRYNCIVHGCQILHIFLSNFFTV